MAIQKSKRMTQTNKIAFTYWIAAALMITLSIFTCNNSAYGQKVNKVDTVPQIRKYKYEVTEGEARYIDSILMVALRTSGYELKKADADGVIQGISGILNWFALQRRTQDSAYLKSLQQKK